MANSSFVTPEASFKSSASWIPYIVLTVVLYSSLCSYLRFHRRDAMQKKFNFPSKDSLSKMTIAQAQEIVLYLGELEFPKIFEVALQFALFRTYGIPTISGLLSSTKEFSSHSTASKRYADTGVLIQEFMFHPPHHERSLRAIARMNYIHSQYQKAGKISNEDMLYTLSLFILEPPRWIEKYEWRSWTDMELCAAGVEWKSIGDAMGIQYKGLLAHSEWADGLDFYHDILAWSEEYEAEFMVPAKSNKETADALVPLLLFYVPKMFKPAATHMVGVLMDSRLRTAMSYPTPPRIYFRLASVVFETRRFILRHLTLPRPRFLRVCQLSDKADSSGRYFLNTYLSHPYYVKPDFWNRWGPEGWFVWLSGADVPGSKGDKYIPQGYKFEEVGPKVMKNKGMDDWRDWEEKVKHDRPTGCPVAFGRR